VVVTSNTLNCFCADKLKTKEINTMVKRPLNSFIVTV
jgi:hypothetical protein